MDLPRTLREGFVTGLFLVAPLAVTIFVIQLVYGILIGLIQPFVSVSPGNRLPFAEPIALVVLLITMTAVGIVVRRGIGDTAIRRFDRAMQDIPGVRIIYGSVRDASSALAGTEDQFERVALITFPESGLRTIGFVTAETPDRLSTSMSKTAQRTTHYDVFLPMAPNPMGGFLLIVPEDRLTMTDLSVREGFQLLMTTGMSGDGQFDASRFARSESA